MTNESLLDEKVHMFDTAASVKPIVNATQSLEVPKGLALDPSFLDSQELFGKITAKFLQQNNAMSSESNFLNTFQGNGDLHHASSGGIQTSYDVSKGNVTEARKASNVVADSAPDLVKGICNNMGLESAVSTQSGAEHIYIPEDNNKD